MNTEASAVRIVEIQNALSRQRLSLARREALLAEQRRLWDEKHSGRSYEQINHDVWLVRARERY